MSKYILVTNGVLAGRYDSEVHGDNIPVDAVAVSDELFLKTINENDGVWSLVDNEIIKHPLPEATPEQIQAQKNSQALAYLVSTDWYVVRFSETGMTIPDDIKNKRQEARDSIK